jgi:hypothetical protein
MREIVWKGLLAVLILAIVLVLGACDKELGDKKSGRDVLVQVRLVGVAEGGKDDVTRSGSVREMEEFLTPVGDGMLLGMRMERDEEALRAVEKPLNGDAYFRVVAMEHGTSTFVSYGDFTIDDGCVGGGLHVPDNGDTYDFTCYSYNTNNAFSALTYKQGATIPTSEMVNVFDGTNDLLWEKKEDVGVSDGALELDILLRRVMARVKVVVDCSYNNWSISAIDNTVTLGAVSNTGSMRLASGETVVNDGAKAISWPSLSAGMSQESTEMLVMPKNTSTLTVTIPKEAVTRVSLSQIPSAAAIGTFSTALVGGNSYRLHVRLRTPIWARSNIYWDATLNDGEGALTFVPAESSDDTKQGYQGVFFKWGSLVGISPNDSEDIYKPVVQNPLSGSTWVATTDSWGNIPYMTITVGTPSQNNTTAIDPEQNNLATYQTLLGDICQYLSTKTGVVSGDYRLPISVEFGLTTSGWGEGGTFGNTPLAKSQVNAYGTTVIIGESDPYNRGYVKNITMGNVILPASGWRGFSYGDLVAVGLQGVYWSGSLSPKNDTDANAHDFCFSGGSMLQPWSDLRPHGESVRCVRK